jgi:hypothetical protein
MRHVLPRFGLGMAGRLKFFSTVPVHGTAASPFVLLRMHVSTGWQPGDRRIRARAATIALYLEDIRPLAKVIVADRPTVRAKGRSAATPLAAERTSLKSCRPASP